MILMTREKSSFKPNVVKYPIGAASIYARFSENYQMTTKAKVPIKWAFFQFLNACLQYGFVTKKEILSELEVIFYVDLGPDQPKKKIEVKQ